MGFPAAVVRTAFKQVGESVVGSAVATGGIDIELLFRAGEGDVKQAQAFGSFFVGKTGLICIVKLVPGQKFGCAAAAVKYLPVAGFERLRIPNEGAVYERILQTFGSVHGYDFNQCFVAFQPYQVVFAGSFFVAGGETDLFQQPLVQ